MLLQTHVGLQERDQERAKNLKRALQAERAEVRRLIPATDARGR
jgi:hypothetical protein